MIILRKGCNNFEMVNTIAIFLLKKSELWKRKKKIRKGNNAFVMVT